MAQLIDLDKIRPIDFPSVDMDGMDVVRYLATLPTVDAVEVVRCKDCASGKGATHKVCPLYRDGLMKDDGYCSAGERKDNDNRT